MKAYRAHLKNSILSLRNIVSAIKNFRANSRELKTSGFGCKRFVKNKIGVRDDPSAITIGIGESSVGLLFISAVSIRPEEWKKSGLWSLKPLNRSATKIPGVSRSDSGKQPKRECNGAARGRWKEKRREKGARTRCPETLLLGGLETFG